MIHVTGSKQKDPVPVRGHSRTEKMIRVIGSKVNGCEVMRVRGKKGKDEVPVTGNMEIKRTIPVIGSTTKPMIPVTGYKQKKRS